MTRRSASTVALAIVAAILWLAMLTLGDLLGDSLRSHDVPIPAIESAQGAELRPAPASAPRAVGLPAARIAPTRMTLLRPAHVWEARCPGGAKPTDVNAYRWNGNALAPQTRDQTGMSNWTPRPESHPFRSVTWDPGDRRTPAVFVNGLRVKVIVAIWCD